MKDDTKFFAAFGRCLREGIKAHAIIDTYELHKAFALDLGVPESQIRTREQYESARKRSLAAKAGWKKRRKSAQ